MVSSIVFGNHSRTHNNLIGIIRLLKIGVNPIKRFFQPGILHLDFSDLPINQISKHLGQPCYYNTEADKLLVSSVVVYDYRSQINKDLGLKMSFYDLVHSSQAFSHISFKYYNGRARILSIELEERLTPMLEKHNHSLHSSHYVKHTIYSEGLHFDRLPIDQGRVYITLKDLAPISGGGTLYCNRLQSLIASFLGSCLGVSHHSALWGRMAGFLHNHIRPHQFSGPAGSGLFFATPLNLHSGARPDAGSTRIVLRFLLSA